MEREIAKFHLDFQEQRWHTLSFIIPDVVCSFVQVDFENTKGHNEIQLGEIILMHSKFAKQIENLVRYTFEESEVAVTAEHDVMGGGTGREYACNLLNPGHSDWNKWYQNSS